MRDALFMGRLTAQATHELQNILATIRESSGLMEDLLAMGGENFAHAERFKKGLCVMGEQVERGMALTEQLNHCAHSPETRPAGAEVSDTLRALVGLFRRIAAQHRVTLVLAPGRAGLRTGLRGVELMLLVGQALDCALPLLCRDAQLMVSVEEQGGLAVARIDSPGFEALRQCPQYSRLHEEAKSLGVGLCPGPNGQGLVLSLPKAPA